VRARYRSDGLDALKLVPEKTSRGASYANRGFRYATEEKSADVRESFGLSSGTSAFRLSRPRLIARTVSRAAEPSTWN
jgi:hypothetical protein